MLRISLKTTLLKVYETYVKHKRDVVKIYEIGRVYFNNKGYKEQRTLGIILSGKDAGYQDVKGVITTLSSQLGRTLSDKDYCIDPISSQCWYLELNIDALFLNPHHNPITVLTSLPQIVLHDLSLTAPVSIKVGEMMEDLKQLDTRIYEINLGEKPKENDKLNKTIFLKVSYKNPNNDNLSKGEVDEVRQSILSLLESKYSTRLNL